MRPHSTMPAAKMPIFVVFARFHFAFWPRHTLMRLCAREYLRVAARRITICAVLQFEMRAPARVCLFSLRTRPFTVMVAYGLKSVICVNWRKCRANAKWKRKKDNDESENKPRNRPAVSSEERQTKRKGLTDGINNQNRNWMTKLMPLADLNSRQRHHRGYRRRR